MVDFLTKRQKDNKAKRESVCHYLLIYLMVAFADSFLYDRILVNYTIPFVLLLTLVILINRKYQLVYPLSILALGLVTMLLVRAATGALGPTELIGWAAMIGITFVAVQYDASRFLLRFVNLAAFLTGFSLIVFLLSQFVPGIWSRITPFSFLLTFGDTTWLDSVNKIVDFYQANGLFLYVDRGFDSTRNVGIFREPAVYQILLNSMLFVLLFMRPGEIEQKRWRWLLVLFAVGVLSTKSATGYATMLLLFFAYALTLKKQNAKIPVIVPIALGTACAGAFVIATMGNSSWMADSVVGRFLVDGQISIDSSGEARVGAANAALSLIPQYPLGCGYDVYGSSIVNGNSEFVGACYLKVAAVYGPIMGIAILVWVFLPVLESKEFGVAAKLSFAAMYFIATYLECEVFYTTLIFIPVYLYCKNITLASEVKLRTAAPSFGGPREAR